MSVHRSLITPTSNPLLEQALRDKLQRRAGTAGTLGELEPLAIRLGLIEHHYRTEWEWDEELMPRNVERLAAWREAADGTPGDVIETVRVRLDDDLDSPGAVAAVDAAARRGESVADSAALLGVLL